MDSLPTDQAKSFRALIAAKDIPLVARFPESIIILPDTQPRMDPEQGSHWKSTDIPLFLAGIVGNTSTPHLSPFRPIISDRESPFCAPRPTPRRGREIILNQAVP